MKFVIHQREGKGASGLAPNQAIRARGLHELQPNDYNISAQNIAILSAQHLQAPAKQSHRFSKTYRNIAGCHKLCAIGHPIATRCDMLGIGNRTSAGSCPGATLLHEPGQTTTTSCNIHKCCIKTLASLKF